MSFSSEVREELSHQIPKAKHCLAAQLQAVLTMCGGVSVSASDRVGVRIQTENIYVVRSFCECVKKLMRSRCEVSVRRKHQGKTYYIAALTRHEEALSLLEAAGLKSVLYGASGCPATDERDCCMRAYLRGSFLAGGSVSDPRRSYHLEMTCAEEEKAHQLCSLLGRYELDARIVVRKGRYIVYLKEAEQIVTLLALMGAPKSLMELENVRILRGITGDVNRRVNCETANINKTVEAAVRQMEDIRYLSETIGLAALPPGLQQIAALRLENPDAPLTQLGLMLDPPVGKSGVNHRLRKISAIAESVRNE